MKSRQTASAMLSRGKRFINMSIGCGVVAGAALLTAPDAVRGGSGQVNTDGTIDITVNLRFPPTTADMANMQAQVVAASQVLWDASEGQLRFGDVTMTCGSVNEDLADMWVFPQPGRAGVSFFTNGAGLGTPGLHVTQFLPSSTGIVVAHEFGHLALGMGDEYSEQSRFGACWGYGPCTETGNLSEQNHCLMQQPGGFSQTEFCTAMGHDTVLGDGLSCASQAVPHGCTDNCEFFNHGTGRYETTQQTNLSAVDCWTHVGNNFGFLAVPAGLPQAAGPAGFIAPNFIDTCGGTDTVMLILDRSGSMAWNTNSDNGEVCGDGIDNDGDGDVDEADCTQPRIEFVKAAARAWLTLASGQDVRAGVVSFSSSGTLDQPFQEVDAASLPALNAAVDAIAPSGGTGIGTALLQTIFTFDAETTPLQKTAFLVSDGVNTAGPHPSTVVGDLTSRNIRVFTISTGAASDDATLSDLAGGTNAATIDSQDAGALVSAFALQWANYRNIAPIIPRMVYSVNAKNDFEDKQGLRTPRAWASNSQRLQVFHEQRSPRSNWFQFVVEPRTPTLTLVFAGNMGEMQGFGVQARLEGPGGATFDTEVASPEMEVTRDPYFMIVEIQKPQEGTWDLEVTAAPGADPLQTGGLTIISDNPDVDLFTSVDRRVVRNPATPVEVTVVPIYVTPILDPAQFVAWVVRPDGSTQQIPLESASHGAGNTYRGLVQDLTQPGRYEVRVYLRTGHGASSDPGEAIWEDAPSTAVVVPDWERTAGESFFVERGRRACTDFREMKAGAAHNPLVLERTQFASKDGQGKLLPDLNLSDDQASVGVRAAERLEISLPRPSTEVELLMVDHARGASVTAYDMHGNAVVKASVAGGGARQTVVLRSERSAILRIVIEGSGETLLFKLCRVEAEKQRALDPDRPKGMLHRGGQ